MLHVTFTALSESTPATPYYVIPGDHLILESPHERSVFKRYSMIVRPTGIMAFMYGHMGMSKSRYELEYMLPGERSEAHSIFDEDGTEFDLHLDFLEFPDMPLLECPMCEESIHPFRMLAHTDEHRAVEILNACISIANYFDWLDDALKASFGREKEYWEDDSPYVGLADETVAKVRRRLDTSWWYLRQQSGDTDVPRFHWLKPPHDLLEELF